MPLGAIVLAAGRSTRFRSQKGKLVHPFGGRPLIQWSLSAVREIGAEPIVVVVGHGADAVKAACGPGPSFVYQHEQHGTGHAVLMAEPLMRSFAGDLLVLYPDVPLLRAETLRRMVEAHRAIGAAVTVTTAELADPFGWGRIVRRDGKVAGIVEERDATPTQRGIREVNVGFYCAQPEFLFSALNGVRPDNDQGEIYLTDIVAAAVTAGAAIADVQVDVAEVGQINSRKELADLERVLFESIRARWMDAGVTFVDPATAYVEPEVTIGRDTIIGPNVQLRGRTVIGEDCRFDGTALLTDTVVGDGAHIGFGVELNGEHIAAGGTVPARR